MSESHILFLGRFLHMKKLYLLFSLCITVLTGSAQQSDFLHRLKGNIGLPIGIPLTKNTNGGIGVSIETKYAVTHRVEVGVRVAGDIVSMFNGYEGMNDRDYDAKSLGSVLGTADLFFSDDFKGKPFIGIGLGTFYTGVQTTNGVPDYERWSNFGGLIRTGGEFRHFRLALEYHLIPNEPFIAKDQNGNDASFTGRNNFLTLNFGITIGGGSNRK